MAVLQLFLTHESERSQVRHSKGRGRTETVKNPCPTSGGLRPVLNAGFGDFLQGGPFGGGDSV